MKASYVLSAIVLVLCLLLFRTASTARDYQALAEERAAQLHSLSAEHQYFVLPLIGSAIERPMVVSEAGVIDSLADGIYVRAVSTCLPCQVLHDSLRLAGIDATFVLEETEAMLADSRAGRQAQLPKLTGVTGGFLKKVPVTGTPGISVVRDGRIVEFVTGVVPVRELRRLESLLLGEPGR